MTFFLVLVKAKVKQLLNQYILGLNILQRHGSDEQQVKYQRIATRIYMVILTLSLIVLSFYIFVRESTRRKTIVTPLQRQYDELYRVHGDNLYCSCSSISTEYSTFVHIEASFHQICSSDFISKSWFDYIGQQYLDEMLLYPYDFRSAGPFQFQLLLMLCGEAQQTVNSSLYTFLRKQFLSSQLLSQADFESKLNMSIRS